MTRFQKVVLVGGAAVLVLVVIGSLLGGSGGSSPSRVTGSDDQLTAIMRANIIDLYSTSDWYPALRQDPDGLDLGVRDGIVIVATLLPSDDVATADRICRAVAAVTNDPDTAAPLGISGVVVISGAQKVADCRP
jgi:hypothetical protein